MSLKILFYSVFSRNDSYPKILFAISTTVGIPTFAVERNELQKFIETNFCKRKNDFDFYINKGETIKYLVEWAKVEDVSQLPKTIQIANEICAVSWYLFPQAVKYLSLGNEKNFLQLAVQYISNGGIDESVIAADFDEAFLQKLKEHSKGN
ncbi:hypothetical protein QEJ31_04290 [Pigmentibacter sp. JX0631]|uniref:hypothetical protein n=1 Tax=Pigmentibacter sp. JX0631 TaxID=2976982 RepID=UPI00246833B0|nr:hypothetical protein [Pigmentibacter sp. JX0631]WGL60815.1 hypothetical protein QEJ31_04290 [Pigmentibacter sp. JX0631]